MTLVSKSWCKLYSQREVCRHYDHRFFDPNGLLHSLVTEFGPSVLMKPQLRKLDVVETRSCWWNKYYIYCSHLIFHLRAGQSCLERALEYSNELLFPSTGVVHAVIVRVEHLPLCKSADT